MVQEPVELTIPVGTQIVVQAEARGPDGQILCRPGGVGVITGGPAGSGAPYRVQLPSGAEVLLARHELRIRKHVQRDAALPQPPDPEELWPYIIYSCVVGSRAYGLDSAESDTDRRGIYLPPADLHWSLAGLPEQLEHRERDECFWELQKFLTLALKANPNVLECLHTPLVEHATPLAQELLDMRAIFLSRQIYQTYNGYVMSQFKRMEQDLRTAGQIRTKHAMHLIRLLLSGITALREGFVPVRVEQHRAALLAIKRGEMPWYEVNRWRLELHRVFDDAFASTNLPDHPDYARADAFLVRARREMAR
ncbi:MAG: nucleotidyltransferase domain-containing protein [Roseiflexaceae bacterium]